MNVWGTEPEAGMSEAIIEMPTKRPGIIQVHQAEVEMEILLITQPFERVLEMARNSK